MVLITNYSSYWGGESKPTFTSLGGLTLYGKPSRGVPQENDLQLVGFPYQFTSFQWIFAQEPLGWCMVFFWSTPLASGSEIPPQQDLPCEALDDPTTVWRNIKHQTQRSPLSTPATEWWSYTNSWWMWCLPFKWQASFWVNLIDLIQNMYHVYHQWMEQKHGNVWEQYNGTTWWLIPLRSGLVHPSYKWINPTKIPFITGVIYNPL